MSARGSTAGETAGDLLFRHIERVQGSEPWGAVLDAGTGRHSLAWVASLPADRWTAVTADPARAERLRKEFRSRMRPEDRILTGDWSDPTFLFGERFDTVLADYLLGALEGYAPYFQEKLFARLRPHVGRRLYVVGLEPFPERAPSPGGELILEIARLRDAAILLAGHRPYREYPLDWVIANLEDNGFAVEDAVSFTNVYRGAYVREQLDVVRRKAGLFRDRTLAREFLRAAADLEERALALYETERGIRLGADYVVTARPKKT